MDIKKFKDLTDKEIDMGILKQLNVDIERTLYKIDEIKNEIIAYKKLILNPTRNIVVVQFQNKILELERSLTYMRRLKQHIESLYKEE